MTLLDSQKIRDLLPQEDLADSQLDTSMGVVAGWLRTASGRLDLDALTSADPLFSAAVELVILLVTNPGSLEQEIVGPTARRWQRAAPGLLARRDQILLQVRSLYTGRPSGSFPDPLPDPDPDWLRGNLVRWTGGR